MKDEQKRFGKGFAVALAVHLVLAAGLGIFGYRFVHTPPEILEVSLEAGGGGAEDQEEDIEQEEQQEEPIIQSLEDIIDQKLKPKPQKKIVKKKATAAPGPKAPAGNSAGNGTGASYDFDIKSFADTSQCISSRAYLITIQKLERAAVCRSSRHACCVRLRLYILRPHATAAQPV